jgi:hypothetical protein
MWKKQVRPKLYFGLPGEDMTRVRRTPRHGRTKNTLKCPGDERGKQSGDVHSN